MAGKIRIHDVGLMDYDKAWRYQETFFHALIEDKMQRRNRGETENHHPEHHLILCEHPAVYTLGKSGKTENLLVDEGKLKSIGATFYKVDRGGDITFHGPGQLVAYPILDLETLFTDIHKYLRYLEESVINALADYGIRAGRYPGYTGVWLDPESEIQARKICAMGVRCSRWVTMHGIALNINTDLSYFEHMIPCGIRDKQVTSIQKETGNPVAFESVKDRWVQAFLKQFELHLAE